MYCKKCGSYIPYPESSFCGTCGASIQKIDDGTYTGNNDNIPVVHVETDTSLFKSAFKFGCGCVSVLLLASLIIGIVSVLFNNSILFNGEDNSSAPPVITLDGDSYNIQYEWNFKGQSWQYDTKIPEDLYDYYREKNRVGDYDEYVLNPYDDDWMENIADWFIDRANEEGWDTSEYIPFALAFVQSLPYKSDSLTTGYDEYPRYPIETLVDGTGDCEDTSILFASIVREMGYGVALLLLRDDAHMAVGVKISQSFIDNWSESYELAYYTDRNGNFYAYCETTQTGWQIGQMPDSLIGTAEIIDVF